MPDTPDAPRFAPDRLREFCERVFASFGVSDADARQAADVLAFADQRGIDSHGVARLKAYADMLHAGRINPRARPHIVRERAGTATVDGDNGLGLVVGPFANRVAMDKAEAVGSGWVSVRGTNHFGVASYYVLEALERGMIGFAMTNSTKLVAPLWGGERMLGTNPIATAFPVAGGPPVVVDLSTSAAAYGKVEIAARAGADMPEGWAIGPDGAPTTDPAAMIGGGALLPLGSDRERGGHKGYALGAMVDVLSAVLSGANWGPFAPPFALRQEIPARSVGAGIGHCFGALAIDGFEDPDVFAERMADWVRTFRATRPAPGTTGVQIPGDPEHAAELDRAAHGIPVVEAVVADLRTVAAMTGVAFD